LSRVVSSMCRTCNLQRLTRSTLRWTALLSPADAAKRAEEVTLVFFAVFTALAEKRTDVCGVQTVGVSGHRCTDPVAGFALGKKSTFSDLLMKPAKVLPLSCTP